MSKPNTTSPLVAAAAAVDEELRAYDELAREAKRVPLEGEKALARAARLLSDATGRQAPIQQKLRLLLDEIEAARARQQASLEALVEVARALEARAATYDGLMKRFVALGEAATRVNHMTGELSARKGAGAPEAELLEGLRALDAQMADVAAGAEVLARDAE